MSLPWNAIINYLSGSFPQLILILASIVMWLYFNYKTKSDASRTLKRDELKLLSEILENKEVTYREFLLEQTIELKYSRPISWPEIEYLINLPAPSKALSNYMDAYMCLEFDFKAKQPVYSGWFKTIWYRTIRKRIDSFCYFIFALGGINSLYLAFISLTQDKTESSLIFIIFSVMSFILAIFCLKGYVIFLKAEKLMALAEMDNNAKNGSA